MFKGWIYRTSLRKRIWVSFAALAAFCIAVTGLCAYAIAARAMERNAISLNRNVLQQSVNVLDQKLKQIIVASSTIMLSETYRQTMRDIQADNRDRYFANFSLLQGPFTQASVTENSIDSILISTPAGDFYPTSKIRRAGTAFTDTELYRRIKDDPQNHWVESHTDELFAGDAPMITLLLQPLTDYYVPDVFLAVNVKEDMLQEAVNGSVEHSGRFLLIDTSGSSVYGDGERPDWTRSGDFVGRLADGEGSFEYDTGSGPMLVSYSKSRYAGDWVLVSYLSKDTLLRPVRVIQWTVLTIMAACIGIALLLGRSMSNLLLGPLLKLQKTMRRVQQEELTARFVSPFEDEIGEVGRQFNQMLDRIGDLIAEVKDNETEKRKAEVKALQAQIDPHFLYNTLNTIFWKCEMDEYDDVKEMVLSLSALFRLGLNNGLEITTLDKELEHVRQYLNIQQQCYEGLFEYSIHAEPDLLKLPVLKILLQPLVENSILHGLRDRRDPGPGEITVTAELSGSRLLLTVTDNGSGMNVEALQPKLQPVQGRSGGYALSNIISRLQLYYGSEASLTFRSQPLAGTVAVISIPFERSMGT